MIHRNQTVGVGSMAELHDSTARVQVQEYRQAELDPQQDATAAELAEVRRNRLQTLEGARNVFERSRVKLWRGSVHTGKKKYRPWMDAQILKQLVRTRDERLQNELDAEDCGFETQQSLLVSDSCYSDRLGVALEFLVTQHVIMNFNLDV